MLDCVVVVGGVPPAVAGSHSHPGPVDEYAFARLRGWGHGDAFRQVPPVNAAASHVTLFGVDER